MPKVTALRKARVPFDPVKYAWNVAHSRVRKADRPVTLADQKLAKSLISLSDCPFGLYRPPCFY